MIDTLKQQISDLSLHAEEERLQHIDTKRKVSSPTKNFELWPKSVSVVEATILILSRRRVEIVINSSGCGAIAR